MVTLLPPEAFSVNLLLGNLSDKLFDLLQVPGTIHADLFCDWILVNPNWRKHYSVNHNDKAEDLRCTLLFDVCNDPWVFWSIGPNISTVVGLLQQKILFVSKDDDLRKVWIQGTHSFQPDWKFQPGINVSWFQLLTFCMLEKGKSWQQRNITFFRLIGFGDLKQKSIHHCINLEARYIVWLTKIHAKMVSMKYLSNKNLLERFLKTFSNMKWAAQRVTTLFEKTNAHLPDRISGTSRCWGISILCCVANSMSSQLLLSMEMDLCPQTKLSLCQWLLG